MDSFPLSNPINTRPFEEIGTMLREGLLQAEAVKEYQLCIKDECHRDQEKA